jgi:tetratricopeptide (TPR) repeat protein
MGVTLEEQGKLEEAIKAYNKALAIEPDNDVAWNNIVIPLQTLKMQVSSHEELVSFYPKDKGSNLYEFNRATLNYILSLGSVHAESALEEALNASGDLESKIIHNPDYNGRNIGSKMPLTDKVVALVHWGRSGTGLLHSLIDDHPEVSTLPSIYLSEYFSYSIWERIISDGWSHMAERFIDIYDVLFDATSTVPVQTKSRKLLYGIGQKEGMANVGDKRDEVLRVDKELFHAELTRLMSFCDQLDALLFFKLVHKAYDKAINDIHQKSLIFYHIHNPSAHTQLNFVGLGTKANWVMMVREPLQSCESWLRDTFRENDYAGVATYITSMLSQIDNIIYYEQNSVGVRLEDLKERPRQTIPALCNWMGIEETESLYEMTAQGKKWWGDPTSPDFAKDGMDPFGKTSIKRKIGSIFSERDQYILRTLFYPFSVRFGYVNENTEQFKRDLQTIRPMLDEMFDFEKLIVERTQVDQEQFMKSGSYLYLRSGLIERWNVLQEFGTYPNMIQPLNI